MNKKTPVIDGHSPNNLELKSRLGYEILALPKPKYTPEEIRAMRLREGVTQAFLAKQIRVNVRTIRRWERGEAKPRGSAAVLLRILGRRGLEAILSC